MGSRIFTETDPPLPGIKQVAERLGLDVRQMGGRTVCRCPVKNHEHDDTRPACVLNGILWYCHKCEVGGDVVGLVKAALSCDAKQAFTYLREQGFLPEERGTEQAIPLPNPLCELASRRGWKPEALEALGALPRKQEDKPAEVFFPMRDSGGEIIGWRIRRADNKRFGTDESAPKCLSARGSRNGIMCPWPLPEGNPVLVVEGEADAAAALSANPELPVVATPGAAPGNECLGYLQKLLAGRSVILAPHSDASGIGWRDRVARALRNVQCEVSFIPPEEGKDLDERLRFGANLGTLLTSALPWKETEGETTVERLLDLLSDVEFVYASDESAWAIIPSSRAIRIDARGNRFTTWLRKRYLRKYKKPPRSTDVTDLLGALLGDDTFSDERPTVYTRVAEYGGKIYLDLGRKSSARAVEITPEGWHIVDRPPVLFSTPRTLAPLPEPQQGKTVEGFRAFIELIEMPPEDAFLAAAWLLGCLQIQFESAYPVLLLLGPAGSGKSTRTKLLRSLIDPAGRNGLLVSGPPRENRDTYASAGGAHILALDNLSAIPRWLSDLLASIATGSGQTSRQLFTDYEMASVQVCQPIILNGINIVGLGEDLMDRAIVLQCEPLKRVQPGEDFWAAARAAAPLILGALLDAAVAALKGRAAVRIPAELQLRMIDFARWVKAAEPVFRQVPEWSEKTSWSSTAATGGRRATNCWRTTL